MPLTYSKFEKNLEKFFLYEKKPKIAVGVSGGPDSLALIILLDKWIKKKKGSLIALIVNHRIRSESYIESLNTKKYLSTKKIKSKILFVAKEKVRAGKQNQARDNRFEKLTKYCKQNKIFHLFLGHHFNDNLETFVLRKIAGSNFEGLNSMQETTNINNIQVIRPLLNFTKKDIMVFNKKHNIAFVNDPSNYNIKYSRVAVRKYLMLNQNKLRVIIKEFKTVKKNYLLYKMMIYQLLNLIIVKINYKKIILNTEVFLNLNSELRIKILFLCIKYVNTSLLQPRLKKIENLIIKIYKFNNISLKLKQASIHRLGNNIKITK